MVCAAKCPELKMKIFRRQFRIGLCFLLVFSGMAARAKSSGNSPNILIILADDLGFADLSSYGGKDLRTPHIDRFVREGMRFENFYACPVCSPTRASLLSGRFPEMVGVQGVIRTHAEDNFGYLSRDAVLLPKILQPAGYETALIGKWHLGLESPNTPNERGFDFFHGFLGDMMDDYYTHLRFGFNYMRLNGQEISPPGHATDLFTDWAIDFLREHKKKKFFLYLPYNAPHDPIQPPPEWLEKVLQRAPGMERKRARLVALIEHLDDRIGRVLDELKKLGLEKNTLVIFLSDNGGSLGAGAHNGKLRNGKGTMYEGGLRVPAAIRWPGKIKAGSRSEEVLHVLDVLPTVAAVAGAKIENKIDGRSFLPLLRGETFSPPPRDLFWLKREAHAAQGEPIEAIRRGDWKLLSAKPGAKFELYNLKTDPFEKNNLADSEPEKFKELAGAMEAQRIIYKKIPWRSPAAIR